ncbi:hypothetical protein [Flagellimonas nanhaiensis]|uniref:Uncharacterized protein n=1 Tax=Flagellimonas nanhaiensis TaxID=2292706 RepID=A0A371JUS0_9FLAO|nr:hypothetical protein [Allomuricauda nanhaiensis]RDY61527.1 hypothetical protein DX873_05045 [Allomuricauda nanhaiensis]
MKKKTSFNADRLIGLSAILISLLTLFIFLYQTNLLKEQSRLSVRPRLTFSKTINKTVTMSATDSVSSVRINLSLTVRNDGLGPAIVQSNNILDKGQRYDNIITFFDEVYPKLKEYGVFSQVTELKVGEAVPASETIGLFTYEYNQNREDEIKEYLNITESYEFPFAILIEYSSMYEEKWVVNSNIEGEHPKQLD